MLCVVFCGVCFVLFRLSSYATLCLASSPSFALRRRWPRTLRWRQSRWQPPSQPGTQRPQHSQRSQRYRNRFWRLANSPHRWAWGENNENKRPKVSSRYNKDFYSHIIRFWSHLLVCVWSDFHLHVDLLLVHSDHLFWSFHPGECEVCELYHIASARVPASQVEGKQGKGQSFEGEDDRKAASFEETALLGIRWTWANCANDTAPVDVLREPDIQDPSQDAGRSKQRDGSTGVAALLDKVARGGCNIDHSRVNRKDNAC